MLASEIGTAREPVRVHERHLGLGRLPERPRGEEGVSGLLKHGHTGAGGLVQRDHPPVAEQQAPPLGIVLRPKLESSAVEARRGAPGAETICAGRRPP